MKELTLDDYKTLTVHLFWLNNKTNVVFTVPMTRTFKNETQMIYADFEYNTSSGDLGMMLYLNWSLSIKNKTEDGGKNEFRVNQYNIYQFTQAIRTITHWLTQNEEPVFILYQDTNKMEINPKYEPIVIKNNFNDILEFNFAIMKDPTEKVSAGVELVINRRYNDSTFIPTDIFLNFSYMINCLNPYMIALSLITFAASRTNHAISIERLEESHESKSSNRILNALGAKERET